MLIWINSPCSLQASRDRCSSFLHSNSHAGSWSCSTRPSVVVRSRKQNNVSNPDTIHNESGDDENPYLCEQICTKQKINNCLNKIKVLSFNEKVDIFGCLEITPISSGYCLGRWITFIK